MHTRQALDRIRDVWRGAEPLKKWIDTHVAISEAPLSRRGTSR